MLEILRNYWKLLALYLFDRSNKNKVKSEIIKLEDKIINITEGPVMCENIF